MRNKRIAKEIVNAFKNGRKLLICGNGGSAAQSQHLAAELVGRYQHEREALPAISLTTDTSILTAIANDFGFKHIFSRQIQALGNPEDILLILSTSGKSENCLEAMNTAKKMGMKVFELERDGQGTPYIQEMQLVDIHEICKRVEREFI